jgi:hypothetical protein
MHGAARLECIAPPRATRVPRPRSQGIAMIAIHVADCHRYRSSGGTGWLTRTLPQAACYGAAGRLPRQDLVASYTSRKLWGWLGHPRTRNPPTSAAVPAEAMGLIRTDARHLRRPALLYLPGVRAALREPRIVYLRRRYSPISDVGDEFDRLAGHPCDGLEITIITEHREPLALRGGGDEQINRAGRPVHPAFSKHLLDLTCALICPLGHRHPAEQVMHQPLLFQPVGQRPRRKQELQFYDRAHRNHARDKLVRPRLPQFALQDAEQARGVDQIQGRTHLR